MQATGYSRYCELCRAWDAQLSPTMRQTHVVGESVNACSSITPAGRSL
jgi:hypothetical protein